MNEQQIELVSEGTIYISMNSYADLIGLICCWILALLIYRKHRRSFHLIQSIGSGCLVARYILSYLLIQYGSELITTTTRWDIMNQLLGTLGLGLIAFGYLRQIAERQSVAPKVSSDVD
jgi:hypothetical protein